MSLGVISFADLEAGIVPDIAPDSSNCVRALDLLSDKVRLDLVRLLLQKGEMTVTTLCDAVHMTQPAVSHHLALLRKGGLIKDRNEGKFVHYSVPDRAVDMLRKTFDVLLHSQPEKEEISDAVDVGIEKLVQTLKAVSDQTRMDILLLLQRSDEMNVTSLCEGLKMTQPAVSHHLALMKRADILKARRDKKNMLYSLAPNAAVYFKALQDALVKKESSEIVTFSTDLL